MCFSTAIRCKACNGTKPVLVRCAFAPRTISHLPCATVAQTDDGTTDACSACIAREEAARCTVMIRCETCDIAKPLLLPGPASPSTDEGTTPECMDCIERQEADHEHLRRFLHQVLPSPVLAERRRSLVVDGEEAEREQAVIDLRRLLHSILPGGHAMSDVGDCEGSQTGTPANPFTTHLDDADDGDDEHSETSDSPAPELFCSSDEDSSDEKYPDFDEQEVAAIYQAQLAPVGRAAAIHHANGHHHYLDANGVQDEFSHLREIGPRLAHIARFPADMDAINEFINMHRDRDGYSTYDEEDQREEYHERVARCRAERQQEDGRCELFPATARADDEQDEDLELPEIGARMPDRSASAITYVDSPTSSPAPISPSPAVSSRPGADEHGSAADSDLELEELVDDTLEYFHRRRPFAFRPSHRRTMSGTSLHATVLTFRQAEVVHVVPPRPRPTRERTVGAVEVGSPGPLVLVASPPSSAEEFVVPPDVVDVGGGSLGKRLRSRFGRCFSRRK